MPRWNATNSTKTELSTQYSNCRCLYTGFLYRNHNAVLIGASLSEPHIGRKGSPAIYVSMYVCMYICVRHSVNAPTFYFIDSLNLHSHIARARRTESEQAIERLQTTTRATFEV